MAAGPVMSSVKANPNTTVAATNRYSLFDGFGSPPPDLTLGPPSFKSARRIEDETIRRLSASLNNLISQQHGRNQLPELPIPTYDNGNVDLSIVRPPRRQSPLVPQIDAGADSGQVLGVYKPQPESEPRISDISSELDEPTDYRIFSGSSHLLAHVDSPVQARYGSLPYTSAQKSRPVSMYNSPTTRSVRANIRPDTSGSQSGQSWHHKKAISYSEQRYAPTPHHQDSACPQDLVVRQDSVKGHTQRFLRVLPSLKNLRQAKSHAKRLTLEEKHIALEKAESEFPQVMDIHSALRLKGISPLHDPSSEHDFNQECQGVTDSRSDSRHQSVRKLSAPGLQLDTTEYDLAADDTFQPICRHKSAVSEAPTVDTDILNTEWPQPPSTHPPLPPLIGHQQFGPALTAVMPASQQEAGNYAMGPSPPPSYPLPPVPLASGSPSKQPSKRSLVNPISAANLGLSLKKYNLPNTKSACSKTNNRIKALAANRGLSVDACLTNDASSDCEMAGDALVDPLPSPLNARLNQSSRNSRVRELKKRHLSLLHRDIPASVHSNDKLQGRAVPGPGLCKIPTTVYTKELPKRPLVFDQCKPLPQIPGEGRCRRSSEASASVTKANIGKSRHARSASAWSGGSNRQASETDHNDSLALSEVMVMVDSSPQQTRDFRAGAIRVARPPRRKSSLNKGQMLPSLRYQPSQKRQSQSRLSSSLPIRDQTTSDASLTAIKTHASDQSDIVTTYVTTRPDSGTISPSKASSILEPSPSSLRESDQYKPVAQRTPTPVRHVRNRQYVPAQDKSESCSPSTGKGRATSGRLTSKRVENENLYDEINRMVYVPHELDSQKDPVYGSQPGSADRLRSQRTGKSRGRPSSRPVASSTNTTTELLAHIEADLIKANLSQEPTSPASKRSVTLQLPNRHDDSDTSITPKSSFRSTSSESVSKQARKNSDASMTDPNDYEGTAQPAKDTGRLVVLPSPPRSRPMDTTLIKSKKRYSNMPSWAARSKAHTATGTRNFSDPLSSRTTPYTFPKSETRTVQSTPRRYPRIDSNVNNLSSRPHTPTPDSSDIEITHFLTEADQMDNAIDSFIQSTSASSTTSSCRSRTRLPTTTSSPSMTQRQKQLQRYSAMSNISNIVDLQRIQDQINAVTAGNTSAGSDGYASEAERSVLYGLAMGGCREQEEIDGFGKISLVARSSAT